MIAALRRAIDERPGLRYRPSPGILPFHRSTHKRRLLRAGNQIGKTWAGAHEAWWKLLGNHPYQRACRVPYRLLISVADWETYREISRKLYLSCPDRGALRAGCDWNDDRGWKNRQINLRNGSGVIFRTAKTQSTTGMAAVTVDGLWVDESISRSLFGEALSRVAATHGEVWVTLTPIGAEADHLREHVEGDPQQGIPPREDWDQTVVPLTPENCPHRSIESIEAQKACYGPWEYEQRVNGAWTSIVTERWFKGYSGESIVDDAPPGEYRVGVGMDHGEGVGSEYACLLLWDDETCYVVDEYVNTESTTPSEDADGIARMLGRNGLTLEHVDRWVGDVNSAGKGGAGYSVNDDLTLAFERIARLPPGSGAIRIGKPSKRRGSVEYGWRVLNAAFIRRQLMVSRRCVTLDRSLRTFRGEAALKHPLDALRYIAVPILADKDISYQRLYLGR